MNDGTMVYGATGFMGRLIVDRALAMGLQPVLGARNASGLAQLSAATGLETRCFDLLDAGRVVDGLSDVRCILNAAGPFAATWKAIVDGCLLAGCHYLDVTSEIAVFEALAERDAEAVEAGIGILPGVGFNVAASDCLLQYVASRVRPAVELNLVVIGSPAVSHGTALTMIEMAGKGTAIRRNGVIRWVEPPPTRHLELHGIRHPMVGRSYGDIATGWHSTGAANITVFQTEAVPPRLLAGLAEASWGGLPGRAARNAFSEAIGTMLPRGSFGDRRSDRGMVLLAEALGVNGSRAMAQMAVPPAYGLSAQLATDAMLRVKSQGIAAGFLTPSIAFGADHILRFEGVARSDAVMHGPDCHDLTYIQHQHGEYDRSQSPSHDFIL